MRRAFSPLAPAGTRIQIAGFKRAEAIRLRAAARLRHADGVALVGLLSIPPEYHAIGSVE
jgi:hypothetical protein